MLTFERIIQKQVSSHINESSSLFYVDIEKVSVLNMLFIIYC